MKQSTLNRDPSKVEGQVTWTIIPQDFIFSEEPILSAIQLDGVTNPMEAMRTIEQVFQDHGFQDGEYSLNIEPVVNSYFGPIIGITIHRWQKILHERKIQQL